MVDEVPKDIKVSYPTINTILVPYNLDLVSNGHDILYRNTKNQQILNLIDRDVAKSLRTPRHPSKFKSTEAIIITFNNIAIYGNSNVKFKYQVVITTDYTNTFTILNYERLDDESATRIGFTDPLACKHSVSFFNHLDRRILVRTSNVGEPGKHVFLMTVPLHCKNDGGECS